MHIRLCRRIDNNDASLRQAHQFSKYCVRTTGADLVDSHRMELRRAKTTRGLFKHVILQIGTLVPEGSVLRELRLARRNQVLALHDVMDVVDGKAAALEEERREDPGVGGAEDGRGDVSFKREMPAQGTVAAQNDVYCLVGGLGCLRDVLADGADQHLRLRWG